MAIFVLWVSCACKISGCATSSVSTDEAPLESTETEIEEAPAQVEASPSPIPSPTTPALLEIEAKTYSVKIVKRSHSSRVYLLATEDALPSVGRLLLLRNEAEAMMGFRVLKIYDDQKNFAAKVVRKYENHPDLTVGDSFLGIEKISDITPPPPSAQDQQDLQELEKPEDQNKPPLEEGMGEGVEGAAGDEATEETTDEESQWLSLTAQELRPLDMNHQGVSGQIVFIRNLKEDGSSFYSRAGGFRYGLEIGKLMMLRKPTVQDYLTAELGLFLYSQSGLNASPAINDTYTILTLIPTLRYTLLLSETSGVFFYGGLSKNMVLTYSQATDEILNALNSLLPAGGMGLLFRVGPNWEARVDLGIDMIGFGAVLRF